MRFNRVIAAGALLGTLAACSCSPKDRANPSLPVDATPTKPGEVVVLAGDGKESSQPRDGAYAVQTSVSPVGGITAGQDGSVYFGVKYANTTRVARLAPDGRLHLLDPRLKIYDDPAYRVNSTKLTASKTDLWLFSSENKGSLQKVPLSQNSPPRYMFGATTDSDVVFVDNKGRALSTSRQRVLAKSWKASAFGLGPDDQPIVATESGDLYELLGENRLHPWSPTGYQTVLNEVRQWGGRLAPLYASVIAHDDSDNLYIVGNSTIRIPSHGRAVGVGKGLPGSYPNWSGGVALAKERLLLTRSISYNGVLLQLNSGSEGRRIRLGSGKECVVGGARTGLSEGGLYGLTRRPDGTLATTACNHVFGFRLPG